MNPSHHAAGSATDSLPARRVGFTDLVRLTTGHGATITVAIVLTLVGAALGLAQPLMAKHLVDSGGRGSLPWALLLGVTVLFLAEAVITALGRFLLERMGERVVLGLRRSLVSRLLRLKMREYDRHRTGDLISRVTTDTSLLREVVSQGIVDLATGVLTAVGAVVLMLWIEPLLLLLVALTVTAAAVVVASLLTGIRLASEHTQSAIGDLAADLEEALGAIRMVRSHRAEQRESEHIDTRIDSAYTAGVRTAKLASVMSPAVELAVHGSFLLVLVIGGMRVAGNDASLGELVAFLLYASYLVVPLSSVFRALGLVQKGMGALQRIEEALAAPVELDTATSKPPVRKPVENHVLALRDVWFGYGDRPVLRGVSLTVPRGHQVALVGRSGVGKSTIFSLVARFHEPDCGAVLFDGTPAANLSRNECRRRVAIVDQNAPVVRGTLRHNITYAAPEADADEVRRVVELANLDEVVDRLPEGLDSRVGERGNTLSAGERQRVAIARALLTRPTLLLLDEPTAHLDAINESALARAMGSIAESCSLLVIAHRLSTVCHANQIVVLEDGVVVEAGSHDHLLTSSQTYRTLVASQTITGTTLSDAPHGHGAR